MPQTTLTLISSMATKALLADLVAAFAQQQPDTTVAVTSVGGVDAAKRVVAGEAFDIVALASDAIARLAASGHVVADTRVDLVHSAVAVLGYSTGPSGGQLAALFERWGIAQQIAPRIVTPPPGVSVGSLVAQGQVALGFQQLSEMMGVPGIQVIGGLPEAVQIVTTFSAARSSLSQQTVAVQAFLAFAASPATAELKQRHGMQAV